MVYVEEKGLTCENHAHRRNHTISAERDRYITLAAMTARAS
jgi:hypothetical protein